jgi:hypothetical protein
MSQPAIISYSIRFLISLLTMEFILHFMYVVAMKDAQAWVGSTPAQIAMIGFWNLIIVWLKVFEVSFPFGCMLMTVLQLLNVWRFFRLWAMLDGIEAPENMVRCMANNYSTLGFWRSWHRSYNLWLTRYFHYLFHYTFNIVQIHLHSRRRLQKRRAQHTACLHFRCAMARSYVPAPCVGLARQFVRPARTPRAVSPS